MMGCKQPSQRWITHRQTGTLARRKQFQQPSPLVKHFPHTLQANKKDLHHKRFLTQTLFDHEYELRTLATTAILSKSQFFVDAAVGTALFTSSHFDLKYWHPVKMCSKLED